MTIDLYLRVGFDNNCKNNENILYYFKVCLRTFDEGFLMYAGGL